jgi:predicted Zn finger-like uncharacterized protein
MNIRCPECDKVYRVDPRRVPAGGVRTRCEACGAVFMLGTDGVQAVAQEPAAPEAVEQEQATPPEPAPASAEDEAPPAPATPSPAAVFGPQDPQTRARRLARALVSDIVVYHPERRQRSLAAGTLRMEFRDEILKSWDEYVEQVGEDMAKKTPFFRDALNEILAKGQKVF